jgi:F-type H+-transporting ATPase subunit b
MRRGWLPGLLTLVLALTDSGLAFGAGRKDDIFALRFDLGLWSIVVFLILFFVLKKYAWGPILQGLQKREQDIRGAIEEAHKTREEAQHLRAQLQEEWNKAHEKVRDILEEGRRATERNNAEMIAKAKADIQAERDRLHREMETARDQALKELWDHTAQLATLISAKALRREVNPDDHRRLVDEALAELGQAGEDYKKKAGARV